MNNLRKQLRIGVLASGEGTTLQAVLDSCAANALSAQVVVVISNNQKSGALRRARHSSVADVYLSSLTHPNPISLDQAISDALLGARADIVLLAGYMKKVGPRTLAAFKGKIINTHPALLPKYGGQGMYGSRVHQAVVNSGEIETGVSIHVVDEEYDHGPLIAQTVVSVVQGDTVETLSKRVQEAERAFLIDTLRRVSLGEGLLQLSVLL